MKLNLPGMVWIPCGNLWKRESRERMSFKDSRLSHPRFENPRNDFLGGDFRPRSASVSSVQIYQQRRKHLKSSLGGSQWSLSTSEDKPFAKMTQIQALLLGLYQAWKERDAIFLASMSLIDMAEKLNYDELKEDDDQFDDDSPEVPSLSDFLVQLATEERKQSDIIFKWLYSHNGLQILNHEGLIDHLVEVADDQEDSDETDDDKENSSSDSEIENAELKGNNISELLFAIQSILQRRASHIAGLLELRSYGERMLVYERSQSSSGKGKGVKAGLLMGTGFYGDILNFLKSVVEKFCQEEQEVNKQARTVMLSLETRLKEINGF